MLFVLLPHLAAQVPDRRGGQICACIMFLSVHAATAAGMHVTFMGRFTRLCERCMNITDACNLSSDQSQTREGVGMSGIHHDTIRMRMASSPQRVHRLVEACQISPSASLGRCRIPQRNGRTGFMLWLAPRGAPVQDSSAGRHVLQLINLDGTPMHVLLSIWVCIHH